MYPNNDGKRLPVCLTAFHSTTPAPCAATALSTRAKSEPAQHACAVCFMNELD